TRRQRGTGLAAALVGAETQRVAADVSSGTADLMAYDGLVLLVQESVLKWIEQRALAGDGVAGHPSSGVANQIVVGTDGRRRATGSRDIEIVPHCAGGVARHQVAGDRQCRTSSVGDGPHARVGGGAIVDNRAVVDVRVERTGVQSADRAASCVMGDGA